MNARKILQSFAHEDLSADDVAYSSSEYVENSYFLRLAQRLKDLFSPVPEQKIFSDHADDQKLLAFAQMHVPLLVSCRYHYAAFYQFYYFHGWLSDDCTVKIFCNYMDKIIPNKMKPLHPKTGKPLPCRYDSVVDYTLQVATLEEWRSAMYDDLNNLKRKRKIGRNLSISKRAIDSIAGMVESLEKAWNTLYAN